MAIKEHQPLVNHCCSFCCKAVDFGTHDYCPETDHCARCPYWSGIGIGFDTGQPTLFRAGCMTSYSAAIDGQHVMHVCCNSDCPHRSKWTGSSLEMASGLPLSSWPGLVYDRPPSLMGPQRHVHVLRGVRHQIWSISCLACYGGSSSIPRTRCYGPWSFMENIIISLKISLEFGHHWYLGHLTSLLLPLTSRGRINNHRIEREAMHPSAPHARLMTALVRFCWGPHICAYNICTLAVGWVQRQLTATPIQSVRPMVVAEPYISSTCLFISLYPRRVCIPACFTIPHPYGVLWLLLLVILGSYSSWGRWTTPTKELLMGRRSDNMHCCGNFGTLRSALFYIFPGHCLKWLVWTKHCLTVSALGYLLPQLWVGNNGF